MPVISVTRELCQYSSAWLRDGPLEKWWGWGGVGLFQLAGFFFFSCPLPLQDLFLGQVQCKKLFLLLFKFYFIIFFFGGGTYSTVAILIVTLATIWLLGTGFKQIFFIFHTVDLLYCQNYTTGKGKHNQVSDTFKGYCLTDGAALHFLFDV